MGMITSAIASCGGRPERPDEGEKEYFPPDEIAPVQQVSTDQNEIQPSSTQEEATADLPVKTAPKASLLQRLGQCTCCEVGNAGMPSEGRAPVQATPRAREPATPGELPRELASKQNRSRPKFSGSWVLARVEGDPDSFLRDCGKSWMFRSIASGISYGVGKTTADIEHMCPSDQHLEEVRIRKVGPDGADTITDIRLNGSRIDIMNDVVGMLSATVGWSAANELVLDCVVEDTGAVLTVVLGQTDDNEIYDVNTSHSGCVLKQFWRLR